MLKTSIMLKIHLFIIGSLMANTGFAQQSLAIHAFISEDIYTGMAVADSLYHSLEPDETAMEYWNLFETGALEPPLPMLANGEPSYLKPSRTLGTAGNASRNGARVLQQILNVDVIITGNVRFLGEDGVEIIRETLTAPSDAVDGSITKVVLEVFIATKVGSETLEFTSPSNDLAALTFQAAQALSNRFALKAHEPEPIDLEGTYGRYIRLLALLDSGFVQEAKSELEQFVQEHGRDYPLAGRLAEALESIEAGKFGEEILLSALLSTKMLDLEPQKRLPYFERLSHDNAIPLYDLWLGILRDEVNDRLGANQAFAKASQGYAYAEAVEASYRSTKQLEGAEAILTGFKERRPNFMTLWALSYAAQNLGDTVQEKQLLHRMAQRAPSITYPFERLSFIAFNEDDAVAAAENLRVALELAPNNDLYWTNYGWAQYLLGNYEGSIEASLKATAFNTTQTTAYYNLGLAYAVQGKFEEAMLAYDIATRINPTIDTAAVADLEQAKIQHPQEATVRFALANLYDLQGKTEEATQLFEDFLNLAPDTLNTSEAERRIEQLTQAPPAFDITEGSFELYLAGSPLANNAVQAGDRIYPRFHVNTDGFELPRSLILSYHVDALSLSQEIALPSNVIAYDIDQVFIDIPTDMDAGTYPLNITLRSADGRSAEAHIDLTIDGKASATRQLLSRGVTLRDLDSAQPFYDLADRDDGQADARLAQVLQRELRDVAELAKENLPNTESGRFAGMNGQEVFEASELEDISDFLDYLASVSGNEPLDITFVDAYAQWVLSGAPSLRE